MDSPRFTHQREIAFGDTDASGWMHFPNIFRYFEEAEHAFLKSCGLLVFDRAQGGWPRVKVTCDYKRPLLTGDRVEVLLEIARVGSSSLTWNFEVLAPGGELAAFGSVITVRVDHEGRPQPLSDRERAALGG
jgi:YbgC/YbaW family acyl-CoA thioester hydrolase